MNRPITLTKVSNIEGVSTNALMRAFIQHLILAGIWKKSTLINKAMFDLQR